MDWAEFLAARLDEREALARACEHNDGPQTLRWHAGGPRHLFFDNHRSENYMSVFAGEWDRILVARDDVREGPLAAHIAANDPAWALADVASKRAILDEHWRAPNGWGRPTAWCRSCAPKTAYPCKTIRLLCEPWSGHPDYPGKC